MNVGLAWPERPSSPQPWVNVALFCSIDLFVYFSPTGLDPHCLDHNSFIVSLEGSISSPTSSFSFSIALTSITQKKKKKKFLPAKSDIYVSSDLMDFSSYCRFCFQASLHAQTFLTGCQTLELYILHCWLLDVHL